MILEPGKRTGKYHQICHAIQVGGFCPFQKTILKVVSSLAYFINYIVFGDKVMFGCESMHIFYILGRVLLTTKPSYRTVLLFGKNKTPSDKKRYSSRLKTFDVFSKIHVLPQVT